MIDILLTQIIGNVTNYYHYDLHERDSNNVKQPGMTWGLLDSLTSPNDKQATVFYRKLGASIKQNSVLRFAYMQDELQFYRILIISILGELILCLAKLLFWNWFIARCSLKIYIQSRFDCSQQHYKYIHQFCFLFPGLYQMQTKSSIISLVLQHGKFQHFPLLMGYYVKI